MLITADNGDGYKIYDADCKRVSYVHSYNTNTKEITVYVPRVGLGGVVMEQKGKTLVPKLVSFTLEGSYATDPQGNRVTDESRPIN